MNRLATADGLFAALDDKGIVYSHWKSNEHLPAAVRGDTDLDLLVRPEDRPGFVSILDGLGFALMVPAPERVIPGVESFLGFDPGTGSLIHLDINYRLVIGEQLLKNHHLPIEDWVLADGGRLEGVRIPAPARELTLLYVRAMLKASNKQFLRSIIKGGSPIPERIVKEGLWLSPQVEATDLSEAATGSGLGLDADEVVDFRRRLESGDLDWRYVRDRRRLLRRRLKRYERMTWYRTAVKRAVLRFRSGSLASRLGWAIPPRRLSGPAPVIAVVGADGSGKSRLTHDLRDWLAWKLDVRHVYFGQPKGGLTWKLLSKPGSMARARGAEPGPLARWTEPRKWLWLARHRRRWAQSAKADAAAGVVVIAERYPLPEFETMSVPMDGPRLIGAGTSLERRELAAYRAIPAPDLTLVLTADLEVLRARKIDLGLEEHAAKVEAVSGLTEQPGRKLIDAGPPYERVLVEAKTAVWEAIRGSR